MMKNITPKYTSYQKRVLGGLLGIIIFSLFLTLLIFVTDVITYQIIAFIFLVGLIIFNVFKLIKRSEKYIKSIEFSEALIELTIADKHNELSVISNVPQNIRIRFVEYIFGFRVGKSYKLQIEVRKNGKFEKILEQYEIGGWNLELFRESYKLYSEVKGISATNGSNMQPEQ